jgi:hypothetical protein
MAVDGKEIFGTALRGVLADQVELLFEQMLAMMEQDIADGWRAFYAREIWFKEHLPQPLINDTGRRYMTERMREAIWAGPGPGGQEYRSAFLEQFLSHPERRDEYRNFLEVGTLDSEGMGATTPLDRTANAVATRLLESGEEHWWYQTQANMDNWYMEATARATLTPPLLARQLEPQTPVRNPDVALANDGNYWRAVHPSGWRLIMDAADYPALSKPECNLDLMSKLAPDFPYAAALSTAKRLIFVQQGEHPWAWALMIDKTDRCPEYRYPPQLILIDRHHKKKLKDEDIVFKNVIGKPFISLAKGPRCMETELLFHLPRSRRLIDFYAPFLEKTMRRA